MPLQFINERKVSISWVNTMCTGLPRRPSIKGFACQCRSCRKCRFDFWVGTIPWRRKWQPTPRWLLGKSRGQRKLENYSPWSCKELDMIERLSGHASICVLYVWEWGWGAQIWVTDFQCCQNLNHGFKQILKIQPGDLNWGKKKHKECKKDVRLQLPWQLRELDTWA